MPLTPYCQSAFRYLEELREFELGLAALRLSRRTGRWEASRPRTKFLEWRADSHDILAADIRHLESAAADEADGMQARGLWIRRSILQALADGIG